MGVGGKMREQAECHTYPHTVACSKMQRQAAREPHTREHAQPDPYDPPGTKTRLMPARSLPSWQDQDMMAATVT